jgi:hypothetical protein
VFVTITKIIRGQDALSHGPSTVVKGGALLGGGHDSGVQGTRRSRGGGTAASPPSRCLLADVGPTGQGTAAELDSAEEELDLTMEKLVSATTE